MSSLAERFLDAVVAPLRPALAAVPDLPERLAAMVEAGRDAWPGLSLDPALFVTFIAARLPADRDPVAAFGAARAADLYLTCACAQGDAIALSAFDRRYMSEVERGLARMNVSASQVDEVKQLVRQKLFVGAEGGTGKIVDYSGRGDLRRWVRSIAVRTCLNELRRHKRLVPDSDNRMFERMSSGDDDPELAYMKERYRNEFRSAFASALTLLTDRQQALLRYHHVDGLNIDEIGAIYRVHRVTAYRWLEKARDALVKQVQKLLSAQLQVERREFESILRLIRSQLHLSLVRHLGNGGDDGGGDSGDGGDGGDAGS